jgi:Tfp pilus assembly protein PilV
MSSVSCRPPSRRRRPFGFSLVELLVAIILIDVALLALVQTTAVVVRRRNEARARATAVNTASARIERLLASPCATASGSASLPSLFENWSAHPVGSAGEAADSVSFGLDAAHTFVLRTRLSC